MSEATCAVLATIFPLVLVAGVIERRSTHLAIRKSRFYRFVSVMTFGFAIFGTIVATIGVSMGGVDIAFAVVAWIAFGIAVGGLGVTLLASLASAELEEEGTGSQT